MDDKKRVHTLDEALRWLQALDAAPRARSTGAWPLVAVLEHLAQSVEMSMDGFPRSRGSLFQNTAGAAAFAVFKWRQHMSHGLAEPIPGAPPLTMTGDWHGTSARLRAAILRFEAYAGALQPHFAYGKLSKADFARAHVLHIANHQEEVVSG